MSSSRCFGGSGERNCWKCALTVSLNAILKVSLFPLTNAFFFISHGVFLVFRSRVHESLRRLCGAKKTKQVLSHILDHILRQHPPPPQKTNPPDAYYNKRKKIILAFRTQQGAINCGCREKDRMVPEQAEQSRKNE